MGTGIYRLWTKLNQRVFISFMNWMFPHIDPVAFSLGPFDVRWYALSYMAGFLFGWRYCLALSRLDKGKRPHLDDIEDVFPWIIVGVILGGRIGYALFYNLDYYMFYPAEILKVWQGGMSFHGGMMGVAAVLIFYPIARGFNMFRLGDIVAAAAPIGLFFGRIANFINAELYGRVTDSPIGMVFPGGGDLPRHPSQLYEALLEGLVLFTILFVVMRNDSLRNKPGFVAGIFLSEYGFFRFIIEFFREPDAHIGLVFDFMSMGQILCIPMMMVGGAFIVLAASGKTRINDI